VVFEQFPNLQTRDALETVSSLLKNNHIKEKT